MREKVRRRPRASLPPTSATGVSVPRFHVPPPPPHLLVLRVAEALRREVSRRRRGRVVVGPLPAAHGLPEDGEDVRLLPENEVRRRTRRRRRRRRRRAALGRSRQGGRLGGTGRARLGVCQGPRLLRLLHRRCKVADDGEEGPDLRLEVGVGGERVDDGAAGEGVGGRAKRTTRGAEGSERAARGGADDHPAVCRQTNSTPFPSLYPPPKTTLTGRAAGRRGGRGSAAGTRARTWR